MSDLLKSWRAAMERRRTGFALRDLGDRVGVRDSQERRDAAQREIVGALTPRLTPNGDSGQHAPQL